MGGGLQGSSKEEGAKGDQGPTVVRGEFPVSRGGGCCAIVGALFVSGSFSFMEVCLYAYQYVVWASVGFFSSMILPGLCC